jgi:cytochrome c oxidase cbb3-type subunit III
MAAVLAAVVGVALFPMAHAGQQHVGQYQQPDIVKGSQLYMTACAVCHGLAGSTVAPIDLRAGRFRTVVSDDDLARVIRAGVPASGMPPAKLADDGITAIVAFVRAGMDVNAAARAVTVGDAARGRTIVHEKADCLRCHRINDRGGRSAPDLSDVASSRSPASLHLSLIDPSRAMLPLNRPVRAVTRDGKTITGRRLNEDTYTVQIADEQGRLLSLPKGDLREFTVLTTSPMPSYKDTLTEGEIADVFAYLLSLRDSTVQGSGRGRGRGF